MTADGEKRYHHASNYNKDEEGPAKDRLTASQKSGELYGGVSADASG